jgi:hypothetical protein
MIEALTNQVEVDLRFREDLIHMSRFSELADIEKVSPIIQVEGAVPSNSQIDFRWIDFANLKRVTYADCSFNDLGQHCLIRGVDHTEVVIPSPDEEKTPEKRKTSNLSKSKIGVLGLNPPCVAWSEHILEDVPTKIPSPEGVQSLVGQKRVYIILMFGDYFERIFIPDVLENDLFFVMSVNSNEGVPIIKNQQLVLIPTQILPTGLIEEVDLLLVVCFQNRSQVQPEDVRTTVKLTKIRSKL